jgi:DNA-directed RNA polymerase subunit beta
MQEIDEISKSKEIKLNFLSEAIREEIVKIVINHKIIRDVAKIKSGKVLTQELIDQLSIDGLFQIAVLDNRVMDQIEIFAKSYRAQSGAFNKEFDDKVAKIKTGDELPQGVLKIVKVYVATKYRLQPGDKMAGRHGNKGVVSRIASIEDMPYDENGDPVDIVLNPLGVPSRMNIGQILETHLGWASVNIGKQVGNILENIARGKREFVKNLRDKLNTVYNLSSENLEINKMDDDELINFSKNLKNGVPFSTGVFEGIKESDIDRLLEIAGFDSSGQIILTDGRTGEKFDRRVTVGYIYMLKLHHLVDNKIHARSIGPYSLITQQPLGGKSHFGGQRFGEMECWALQAYGASYTLQEMLTVKSDDVIGRIKIYESIIQGNQNFNCGIPESFNVMIKEVRSLGLNIELIEN